MGVLVLHVVVKVGSWVAGVLRVLMLMVSGVTISRACAIVSHLPAVPDPASAAAAGGGCRRGAIRGFSLHSSLGLSGIFLG